MNDPAVSTPPSLIVVTGPPGSGKTTLAHALARAVRCPAICRDEIKEGFVNTSGQSGEGGTDIAWSVYETFFDTIRLLLDRRITLIAEAAFQHKLWAAKLASFEQVARVRIIVCTLDPRLARARHVERGLADADRERFHPDEVMRAAREGREASITPYDPPHLDMPTLAVDTSTGYLPSLEDILAFAHS